MYCSMNKQYEEKVYLMMGSQIVITILAYSMAGQETMTILFKEQRQKESENGFLTLSYDTHFHYLLSP